jgi:dTDP-4-amino-4,6-dideoxygalactose transaminase
LVITPYVKNNCKHVFNQYTIRTKDRDELIKFLNENGIPTAVHYPKPLHLQTAFKYLNYREGDFPISETISKEVLSLPMYPEMSENEQKLVIDTIRNFYEKK